MTTLYDSGEMSIGGKRGRIVVTRADSGAVEVLRDSLYGDAEPKLFVYRAGNYPELPADWRATINDYNTTAADKWLHELEQYNADKVVNPYASALGRLGRGKTSKRKAKASAAAIEFSLALLRDCNMHAEAGALEQAVDRIEQEERERDHEETVAWLRRGG